MNSDIRTGAKIDTRIDADAGIDVNIGSESKASSTQVPWLDMMVRLLPLFIISVILSFSFSWIRGGSGNNITHHVPSAEALLSPVITMYSSQPLQSSFTDACLRHDKVGIYGGPAGAPSPPLVLPQFHPCPQPTLTVILILTQIFATAHTNQTVVGERCDLHVSLRQNVSFRHSDPA